jgi:hypothetical protein
VQSVIRKEIIKNFSIKCLELKWVFVKNVGKENLNWRKKMSDKSLIEIAEEILKSDVRARANTKEGINWFVMQVLRRKGFNIFIPYTEIGKFSFESIIKTRREILHKRNPGLDSKSFIPEIGVTYEKKWK